ncbi:hypothetical protein KDA11_02400 [Candidatus Saccharibacteria bacterium]|nr:hypothetical protein [Candidatus Saccharibacteria bacterium]
MDEQTVYNNFKAMIMQLAVDDYNSIGNTCIERVATNNYVVSNNGFSVTATSLGEAASLATADWLSDLKP